jgi:hypothetical protein
MQALVVFFVGLLILLLVGLTVLLVRTAHEESPPPEAVPLDELEILVEDDLSDATPRPPVSKGRPAQPDKGAPAPTVRPTPRTAPDPTPRTAPDPTPRTAPDPTPRPTATPTPRPGAVLGTDEPETPVPTARVTIGHQAPASALLGSPNPLRFRLEPAEAPCRLVLFHASWPPGADGYDSLRLSPVGGGAWEGELFVPYAPEYRNGFRYRASCVAADGAELAAWPASGGTHPVPALAR